MTIRVSDEEVKLEERYAFAKGVAFAVVCMIDYFRFKDRSEKLPLYMLRRINLKLGASFREVLRTGQFQLQADKLHNALSVENPTPEQTKHARQTLQETLQLRRQAYSQPYVPTSRDPEGAD